MQRSPGRRWMRVAVRSGRASRPIVVGSTLIAVGNTPIDSGNIPIGPRDSLARSDCFGRGRK